MTYADPQLATAAEDRLRRRLRNDLVAKIEDRHLDSEALAELVGMLPSGAQALMTRKDWSLATCLRIAASLNCEISATVQPRT